MPADAPSPDSGDSSDNSEPADSSDGEPGDQDGVSGGIDPVDGPEGADDPDGEIGYAAARVELDQILAELSGDDLDVDVLAERVERASTLIEICRGRITNARIQVERVTATAPDLGDQT